MSVLNLPSSGQDVESHEAKPAPQPLLEVDCLGELHVAFHGRTIDKWPSRKGRALFAYLAVNHRHRVPRDILMDQFWPDSTPDSARNCLNVTVHGVRRLFHWIDPVRECIRFRDDTYFIDKDLSLRLDSEEFEKALHTAQRIEKAQGLAAAEQAYGLAAAMYRGDFMEVDLYESWTASTREALKESYLVALDKLSELSCADGRTSAAILLCERILARNPCREHVLRRLMRCYDLLGHRDAALRTFRRSADALKTELEAEPTRATIELYEAIRRDC